LFLDRSLRPSRATTAPAIAAKVIRASISAELERKYADKIPKSETALEG
jgi:hypothetical protein